MFKKTLFILLFGISTAQAENLRKVELMRVIDGDTIEVRYTTSIRLSDIECYENKDNERSDRQVIADNKTKEEVLTAGREAEQKLKDLLKDKENNLYLQVKGLDKFRRILGKLYIGKGKDKVDVNDYMLKSGGCLPYKKLPKIKRGS